MFKTFAAVLVATSMVAGAAVAAAPSTDAGTTPSAVTAGSNTAMPTPAPKSMKHVSHLRKHVIKHAAGAKHHRAKAAHNLNGRHARKTTKAAGVQPARLPATRIN